MNYFQEVWVDLIKVLGSQRARKEMEERSERPEALDLALSLSGCVF